MEKLVELVGGGSVINGAYPDWFSFKVLHHMVDSFMMLSIYKLDRDGVAPFITDPPPTSSTTLSKKKMKKMTCDR